MYFQKAILVRNKQENKIVKEEKQNQKLSIGFLFHDALIFVQLRLYESLKPVLSRTF